MPAELHLAPGAFPRDPCLGSHSTGAPPCPPASQKLVPQMDFQLPSHPAGNLGVPELEDVRAQRCLGSEGRSLVFQQGALRASMEKQKAKRR